MQKAYMYMLFKSNQIKGIFINPFMENEFTLYLNKFLVTLQSENTKYALREFHSNFCCKIFYICLVNYL